MSDILESLMLIAFGLSWPPAIYTSLKTRSSVGKSLLFEICIWLGYAFGIAAKLYAGSLTYAFPIYVFNFLAVSADIILYFRNKNFCKDSKQGGKRN